MITATYLSYIYSFLCGFLLVYRVNKDDNY